METCESGVEACIKAEKFRKTDVEAVTQMMWAGGPRNHLAFDIYAGLSLGKKIRAN